MRILRKCKSFPSKRQGIAILSDIAKIERHGEMVLRCYLSSSMNEASPSAALTTDSRGHMPLAVLILDFASEL